MWKSIYWSHLRIMFACASAVSLLASGAALQAHAQDIDRPPSDPLLDQGWSIDDRRSWYEATQGSRLIPYDWIKALEQPDSEEPFWADAYMAKFRYIPRTTSFGVALPIGFALDERSDTNLTITKLRWKQNQDDKAIWLGMNCAACHTAQITFRGTTMRIDGGPTLADFQGFMKALNIALRETRDDPAKWQRFSDKVLGPSAAADDKQMLANAFRQFVDWRSKVEKANNTDLEYGYGRLDAFGYIYNKVALLVGSNENICESAECLGTHPSDAPVSYPFLWNVPQQDHVQWNGIARNGLHGLWNGIHFDPFALARNAGEVIGVFGDVNVKANAGPSGFYSSIDAANLILLEPLLGTLRPPAWPEQILGKLKPELQQRGKELYDVRCKDCHQVIDRSDLTTQTPAKMSFFRATAGDKNVPPGTDPWMACNAYQYQADSGKLTGTNEEFLLGAPLKESETIDRLLKVMVLGALAGQKGDIISTAAMNAAMNFINVKRYPRIVGPRFEAKPRVYRRFFCTHDQSDSLGYKARSLTGIWATAPYLHNGSVPTLYDLLLPPDERPKSFFLGGREYDPERVGYKTEKTDENSWEFRTHINITGSDQLEPIDGNNNSGHDYGNSQFSEEDRMAIIEYLKSL